MTPSPKPPVPPPTPNDMNATTKAKDMFCRAESELAGADHLHDHLSADRVARTIITIFCTIVVLVIAFSLISKLALLKALFH